jgi:hypothetical protein
MIAMTIDTTGVVSIVIRMTWFIIEMTWLMKKVVSVIVGMPTRPDRGSHVPPIASR